jgi:perosamine synthetase
MIPRLHPPFGLIDIAAALSGGTDDIDRFERTFAEANGYPHGVFFEMGRGALAVLLKVLGLAGRPVAVPAYTCVVVPHAVALSGNRVVFVDTPAHHFNVAPRDMAMADPKAAMVIATPLFGYPLPGRDWAETIRAAAKDAFVLYDLAHAFAACDSQADAALFAFGIGKMLSTGNGGMLLVRDGRLYRDLIEARQRFCAGPSRPVLRRAVYAAAAQAAFGPLLAGGVDLLESRTSALRRYTTDNYGAGGIMDFPSAYWMPSGFQARLGLSQIRHWPEFVARRQRTASRYETMLRAAGVPVFESDGRPSYSQFPLAVGDPGAIVAQMRTRGIQLGRLIDYSCTDLPGYEPWSGKAPHAATWARSMINLPNWPGMTDGQVDRVIEAFLDIRAARPDLFSVSPRLPEAEP